MSERMTNMEIEDVLSSIRRLVSEEARPLLRREVRLPTPESASKLVLTPDFRVSEPTESAEAPQAKPVEPQRPAASLKARLAILESALGESKGEWEPDGSEVGADAFGQVEDEPSVHDAFGAQAEADYAEARMAPETDPQDWLPESAPEATLTEETVPEATPAVEDEPVGSAGTSESHAEPVETAEMAAIPAEMVDWQDEHVTSAPRPDVAHEKPTDEASVFDEDDDAIIDEEGLRDLVRDMIRQELQGALGERITRNVRKLVRAEINRALAGRELDQ
jgi:cell pole-organizing protein PopZ